MPQAATPADLSDLPSHVERVLRDFVDSARSLLANDLVSAVLFGSAAEGRLRATSDVNLILVLSTFDAAKVAGLRERAVLARAAIRLQTMFLLANEIPAAAEAFAHKFADIARRHRVLYGSDPFQQLQISREARVRRLRQVLLNLVLRLREAYAARALRHDELITTVAESAAPLRTSAADLLELEGRPAGTPKEAFAELLRTVEQPSWRDLGARISKARELREIEGNASALLLDVIAVASEMRERAAALELRS